MGPDAASAAGCFAVDGPVIGGERFAGGHIHASYRIAVRGAGGAVRYLLQRINTAVFVRPDELMGNIARIARHLAAKLAAAGAGDVERRVLLPVPTREGALLHRDAAGGCWRMYRYIEGTRTREVAATPDAAYQAARAFGQFQALLADLPPPRLHETIPGFHDTPARLAALERVIAADPCGRAAQARAEIDRLRRHAPLATLLSGPQRQGLLPERIVHNDAKISNVLFDAASGAALCIVDLDTVMPGLALHDCGDLVRSMACPAAEDERDLARVVVHWPLLEALLRGYVAAAGAFLTAAEREHLGRAGQVITYEQAVRFLTDFLAGDTYYAVRRPGHNLDRCRAQLALLESLRRHEDATARLLARL